MAYQIRATWKPTDTQELFGPWPTSDAGHIMFASGFVSGIYAERYKEDYDPERLILEIVPSPDETNMVGTIVAEASASVAHPDGSTS